MRTARAAAMVTWVYAAAYGIPAVPVSIYLLQRGRLPSFRDLFDMYGGPWWFRLQLEHGTFVLLLMAFFGVTLLAAAGAWLLWNGSRAGALLCLVLLPVEAVFWYGFALPIPWLMGTARAVLIAVVWQFPGRARPGSLPELDVHRYGGGGRSNA